MSKGPPPVPDRFIHERPTGYADVLCPHCQASLSIHPSQAGSVIDCPRCGGKFQMPLPAANASPFATAYTADQPADYREFVNRKVAAGICGILLGGLGIHKFILGLNTAGIIMLMVWIMGLFGGCLLVVPALASAAMGVIGLVEGIIYLTKSDAEFYQTYAVQKKEWF